MGIDYFHPGNERFDGYRPEPAGRICKINSSICISIYSDVDYLCIYKTTENKKIKLIIQTAMAFEKITEQTSRYRHLEQMTIEEILINLNNEDKTVPVAVEKDISQIEKLVSAISDKMLAG